MVLPRGILRGRRSPLLPACAGGPAAATAARPSPTAASGSLLILVLVFSIFALGDQIRDRAVLPVAVIFRIVVPGQLAVLDHASPRTGLLLEHLDERLEPVKVSPGRPLDVTHPTSRLLQEAPRLHVQAQLDSRQAWTQLVERDDTGMDHALRHPPLDPLVGALRLDVRRELLCLAPDLCRERNLAGVLLLTRLTRCMKFGHSSNCVHWL